MNNTQKSSSSQPKIDTTSIGNRSKVATTQQITYSNTHTITQIKSEQTQMCDMTLDENLAKVTADAKNVEDTQQQHTHTHNTRSNT